MPLYIILVLFLLGLRNYKKESNIILIFIILTSLLYSIIEGNVGTLARHRLQVVVLMIPFAANGLNILINKLRRNEKEN